ncbi:mechanosensitive ion channel family protein [Flavihumibacter fluvii]|uniref:mechanosensitive ion channel family protein n=1 Tax=Flavihumibacter fluvii TaxID=2838157 RepID=UPI001BDF3155|nr:mechanosensitive ion channel domain-containing protein [Flavihumibacter fluvii]ULQ54596.1 mechanosensitive ion channel [Flavihumibacter fluvii]
MNSNCRRKLLLLVLLSGFFGWVNAQQPDTAVESSFIEKWKKIGAQETYHSEEKYKAGRIAIRQQFLIDEIRATSQRAKIYLRKGIDTLAVNGILDNAEASVGIVNDGVFENTGTYQTQRNLTVSAAILTELLYEVTKQKNLVVNYTRNLVNFRDRIDSLSNDSALYTFPKDSLGIVKYINKLRVVAKEIGPVDTALDISIANIQTLRNRVELMVFSLGSSLEEVERRSNELTARAFDREFPDITGPVYSSRPFPEIIKASKAKEKLALSFYVHDNQGRLLIFLLLTAALAQLIRSLRKRVSESNALQPELKDKRVLQRPVLSAIILAISLFQFIFLDPPFIFSFIFWLIAAICLAVVFRGFISNYWMGFWIAMIILFVLASTDNMILQASRTERWIMLGLSVIGMVYGSYILLKGHRHELKEKGILYFIGFVILMEIGATFFNVYGRYNFSKTLLISGYSGLVIAILFLWTVRFINELLGLTSRLYKHPEKRMFYINFDRIGDEVPKIFYVFLVLGWFILVGRNSYAFKQLVNPFIEFLNTERTLGDYSFTINGLFIFILILTCSMLLSRIISFFASEPGERGNDSKVTGRIELGSWILLIRIFIISTGLFLAFAASGIPLDRITIIIGALGVGIGLGLQGLVNNLVSGLIIAFEKPVNVGDAIEVNGKPGTMKSIGFRSSVVTLADGACLIIPNGDLLSQHLVNWTMGKNTRRLTVVVGVAYGTDLKKALEMLQQILTTDDRILRSPAPAIAAREFNTSTIDIELFFWVNQLKYALEIKGDVITRIDAAFKAEGISIPRPQQDVYIRSFPKQ